MMRVVGIHPARDPMLCGQGPVQVGSAPDSDIVPEGAGVEPRHVVLTADARGLVLAVRPGCQRVYVNARAVRERAILRYGDVLTLGANKFLVTTDSAPTQADTVGDAGAAVGPVLLRIVSGVGSGRALAVAPELHLGAGTRHFGDLAYACRVAWSAGALVFESASAAPRVNGWQCNRVRLSPGDQIVLGEHHLVVEAPGLEHAARLASHPPPAPVARSVPRPADSAPVEVWWLIAAAVLLAVVIAFFLYHRW